MVSGGVLFNSILGLNYHTGLWVVTGVVVAYTLFGAFGGKLDGLCPRDHYVCGAYSCADCDDFPYGRTGETVADIRSVNPELFNMFKGTTVLGIISLFAWGLGYFGQPHIIVRFMAITSVKEIKRARRIGMGWMILSALGALFTGLAGIAYYHQHGLKLADPETILFSSATFCSTRLLRDFSFLRF